MPKGADSQFKSACKLTPARDAWRLLIALEAGLNPRLSLNFKLGPSQMLPEDNKAAQDMKNNMNK